MKRASRSTLISAIAVLTISSGIHAASPSAPVGKVVPVPRAALPPLPAGFPKIDRKPPSSCPENWGRGVMESVPTFNPDIDNPFQMDLRAYDVSRLDFRNSGNDLRYASFDSRTKWPSASRMPKDFNRRRIMDIARNPGLGLRLLHEKGVTGRGVGIAIIDQTLLTDHREYRDQLRLYEELNDMQGEFQEAQMHGTAVASIAVGKTVGVAPEADLYYFAKIPMNEKNLDYTDLARAVRRILEVNRGLPEGRKIRVISMSIGWMKDVKGYNEITAAVQEAKASGLLVCCSSTEEIHGFHFHGLGRPPLADPDVFTSYEPGMFYAKFYYRGKRLVNNLMVPMDSRTAASPMGADEYAFFRQGGLSWVIPYVAGMYALAVQVKPSITPEEFWAAAMQTGKSIQLDHNGEKIPLGPILDTAGVIAALQEK